MKLVLQLQNSLVLNNQKNMSISIGHQLAYSRNHLDLGEHLTVRGQAKILINRLQVFFLKKKSCIKSSLKRMQQVQQGCANECWLKWRLHAMGEWKKRV